MTGPGQPEHGEWDALPVGWALSALDPDDEERFAAHLPDCQLCTATVRESLHTVADLAYALPDEVPPPSLKARLMAAVAAEPRAPADWFARPDRTGRSAGPVPAARAAVRPDVEEPPAGPARPFTPPRPEAAGDEAPRVDLFRPRERRGAARDSRPADGPDVGRPEVAYRSPGPGRPAEDSPPDADPGRPGLGGVAEPGRPDHDGPSDAGRPGVSGLGGAGRPDLPSLAEPGHRTRDSRADVSRPGVGGAVDLGDPGRPIGPREWGRPLSVDRPAHDIRPAAPAAGAAPAAQADQADQADQAGPAEGRGWSGSKAGAPGPSGIGGPVPAGPGRGRHAAPDEDGTVAASEPRRRTGWAPRIAVAAAAAAVLALLATLGAWNLQLRGQQDDLRRAVAERDALAARREVVIRELTADEPARVAALTSTGRPEVNRQATIVVRGDRVEIIFEGLDPTRGDIRYWLWTLDCTGGAPSNLRPIKGFQNAQREFSARDIGSDPGFATATCFALSEETGTATPAKPAKVVAIGQPEN